MTGMIFADSLSRLGTESAFMVLARAQKLAAQGKDIINLGIGQPDFKTPGHIVEAAVKAARVFGLKLAGVDLLRSEGGPKVLEVNSSPGLEGIEKASGKNIAGLLYDHIETHVRPQPVRRRKTD